MIIQQGINYTSNSMNEDASNAYLLDYPIYPVDFHDVEVKDEPLKYDTVSCKYFTIELDFNQYFGE